MAESKRDSFQALEEIAKLSDKAREEGNKYFATELYDEASQWYTECIYICVEKVQEMRDNFSLYSWSMSTIDGGLHAIRKSLNLARANRSEVFLQQEKYEFALADAENCLDFDAKNAKALNRKGRSLEGLQQFEKAHRSFESALKLNPTNKDIQKSVGRTWICFRQSKGEYDPSDFYLHEGMGNNFLDPFCEYVGPLEIQLLPGRGRGLVLTRAVLAGKVLLASRALDLASDGPDLCSRLFNLAAKCKKCRQKLRMLQANKPYDSEDVPEPVCFMSESNRREATNIPQLTALSNPGPSVARCRDEIDVRDVTVGVASLRAFPRKNADDELLSTAPAGADRSSVSSNSESSKRDVPPMDLFRPCKFSDHRELIDNDADEREDPVDMLDMERITQMAEVNRFNVRKHDTLAVELRSSSHPTLDCDDTVGLWLLPSFLNHSCIPNCAVVIVGKDMILRATQDIPKGEELTITYIDPFNPHKRRVMLTSAWPMQFVCSCSRCRFEESIAEPLETLNMVYEKYLDTLLEPVETVEVGFLSATGMTCDNFVKKLDTAMSNLRGLDELHRTWIRASYVIVYCGQSIELPMYSKERFKSLRQFLEADMTVHCTDANGLQFYSKVLEDVGEWHGKRSKDFLEMESKLVEVLRVGYGIEKRGAALKMIRKLLATYMYS